MIFPIFPFKPSGIPCPNSLFTSHRWNCRTTEIGKDLQPLMERCHLNSAISQEQEIEGIWAKECFLNSAGKGLLTSRFLLGNSHSQQGSLQRSQPNTCQAFPHGDTTPAHWKQCRSRGSAPKSTGASSPSAASVFSSRKSWFVCSA